MCSDRTVSCMSTCTYVSTAGVRDSYPCVQAVQRRQALMHQLTGPWALQQHLDAVWKTFFLASPGIQPFLCTVHALLTASDRDGTQLRALDLQRALDAALSDAEHGSLLPSSCVTGGMRISPGTGCLTPHVTVSICSASPQSYHCDSRASPLRWRIQLHNLSYLMLCSHCVQCARMMLVAKAQASLPWAPSGWKLQLNGLCRWCCRIWTCSNTMQSLQYYCRCTYYAFTHCAVHLHSPIAAFSTLCQALPALMVITNTGTTRRCVWRARH